MDTSRPEGIETRSLLLPYCYYYYDYDYCRVAWPPCAHEPSVEYASTSCEVIGLFFLLSTAPTAKLVSRSRDDLLHPFCVRILLSSLSSLFLAKHYAEQVRTKGS